MSKQRLDQLLTSRGLVRSRSQAESLIKLGEVQVNGRTAEKPGQMVSEDADISLTATDQYVSRAALKLASIANTFKLNFQGVVVLDVGSSTGGFTDYALQHGARRVIAVEAGTDQLHPDLQGHSQIELHEQTDIRDMAKLSATPTIVVIDVSFISLREVLPHILGLVAPSTQIVAMVKPQFEAKGMVKHKGVIKNERLRRDILKDFEDWAKQYFVVQNKADSKVAGAKGNLERFYLLGLL